MSSMKTKRLFFGFPISVNISNELTTLTTSVQLSGFRPTSIENLHITLLFLGAVPEDMLHIIRREAEQTLRNSRSFRLTSEKLVYKSRSRSHMLWLQFTDSVPFTRLREALLKTLGSVIDLSKEHGTQIPHTTLGRFRRGEVTGMWSDQYHVELDLRELNLFESIFGPGGVRYEPIASYLLR